MLRLILCALAAQLGHSLRAYTVPSNPAARLRERSGLDVNPSQYAIPHQHARGTDQDSTIDCRRMARGTGIAGEFI